MANQQYHDAPEINPAADGLQHDSRVYTDNTDSYKYVNGYRPQPNEPTHDGSTKKLAEHNVKEDTRPATSRNPFGLSALAFGLLVALVTAVVVGALVGGVVGGTVPKCHRSNKGSSSSPTTTTVTVTKSTPSATSSATSQIQNYKVADPLTVATLDWDCPNLTSFTTNYENPNQQYAVTCGIDWGNSRAAVGGGVVADLLGIIAYTAGDCMSACASFNNFMTEWGNSTRCAGVTFSQELAGEQQQEGANCWLKNGTALNPPSNAWSLGAVVLG